MLPPSVKRRIHFFVIGLAAALILGQRAAAESPFVVDAWNTADGLPQSSVIAITQTRDGYLWLGTLNGLVRFDGNSMTPFNVNNTPGLPDNGIIFLHEDSRTNLWVGTQNGGLCGIQGGTVKRFNVSAVGGKIIFAEEDVETPGAVWFFTTAGKFFRIYDGKLDAQPSQFPAQLFDRIFRLLVPGKNSVVWQLTNGTIQKFRGEKLEKDFGPTPWTYSQVVAQYRRPDGSFLQVPFDANVTAACEDREGNLVVGTHDAGIYWFDAAGGVSHISTDKGLSHDIVLSLCCDREGNLWTGTDGGGLERLVGRR